MKFRRSFYLGIALLTYTAALSLPTQAQFPPGDAGPASQLARLGEILFFEKALSERKNTSCATCHVPEFAFTDQRQFSIGQNGAAMVRNTPSIINRPAVAFQFWDGRAPSLFEQIRHPLENPDEMGASIADACRRLEDVSNYHRMFTEAFGTPDITPNRLTTAIAAYVETLGHYQSDYDRAKKSGLMTSAVLKGERLFFGKARCSSCHSGRNFTDERFHNTGVAWKSKQTDFGRGTLTGREEDLRAFKTPSLRELERTAPYMHDGSMATLIEVIDFYSRTGSPRDPNRDPMLKPMRLTTTERTNLLAFLRSLSDSRKAPFQTPAAFRENK